LVPSEGGSDGAVVEVVVHGGAVVGDIVMVAVPGRVLVLLTSKDDVAAIIVNTFSLFDIDHRVEDSRGDVQTTIRDVLINHVIILIIIMVIFIMIIIVLLIMYRLDVSRSRRRIPLN